MRLGELALESSWHNLTRSHNFYNAAQLFGALCRVVPSCAALRLISSIEVSRERLLRERMAARQKLASVEGRGRR